MTNASLLLLGLVLEPIQPASMPGPDQLIAGMLKLYAECRSYKDDGEVVVAYLNEDGSQRGGDRRPFTTMFVRPVKFRFEFKDESGHYGSRYVIWADGGEVRSWWTNRPTVEVWPSIGHAVGTATGVSGGSASVIAGLLLSGGRGKGPQSLQELRTVGVEAVGGVSCWRIEGRGWLSVMGKAPMALWVDKGAIPHLRQIQYVFDVPDAKSRTTITFRPATNVDIDDSTFVFSPPAK